MLNHTITDKLRFNTGLIPARILSNWLIDSYFLPDWQSCPMADVLRGHVIYGFPPTLYFSFLFCFTAFSMLLNTSHIQPVSASRISGELIFPFFFSYFVGFLAQMIGSLAIRKPHVLIVVLSACSVGVLFRTSILSFPVASGCSSLSIQDACPPPWPTLSYQSAKYGLFSCSHPVWTAPLLTMLSCLPCMFLASLWKLRFT